MAKNFGSGVVGGVVLIDPATGQPYKATGGGGGGVSSWNDLEDKPAVIAAGATAEAAREAIDAQPAGSYLTSVPDATATAKGVVELATIAEATSDDETRAVTPAGLKAAIAALVGGAPGALDTLAELAEALGNDASFATMVTNALTARVRTDTASQGLTGTQQANARANIGAGTSSLVIGTTGSTAAAGNDLRLSDARTPTEHSASLITSGNLGAARNTVSVPHDAWQASGGTWPSRPAVPSGARVNWIGYPGLTDIPGALVTGTDSYTMRTD